MSTQQPQSQPDLNELDRLVLAELALGRLLQHQLDCEHEYLRRQDLLALQQGCQQKSSLLERINQQARQRLDWMQQQQLPTAEEFLQHPLITETPVLGQLWQQLAEQYRQNRQRSEQLSELVLAARHRVQQRLRLLRGPSRSTLVYTQKGKTRGSNDTRGYLQA